MATSFKYLLVSVDGEIFGTNSFTTAEHYEDTGDFTSIESADVKEIDEPEDEDQD